jgi:hypothetical protein
MSHVYAATSMLYLRRIQHDMKRDMELIRLSLLEVEGEEPKPDLSGYTQEQQVYHMALCIEAGLVDGAIVPDGNGYPAATTAIRLSWKGHEFLDAARNNTLWQKTLVHIKKAGVAVTLPVLEDLLKKGAKELLGLQ